MSKEETVSFLFNGTAVDAVSGDTIASALFRAGERTFCYSFQDGRPRGLLCLAGNCPNCHMIVDGVPNTRACTVRIKPGMDARSQNQNVSRNQVFDSANRFPKAPPLTTGELVYEHIWRHVDVAVIGGGPSGLKAALDHARAGENVLLIDDQPELGGHLRFQGDKKLLSDLPVERVRSDKRIEVLSQTSCFGVFEGNLIGVLQREPIQGVAERLAHIRASLIVIATGAYETPLVFANNDLPGVMLSSAVQRLSHVHSINPGKQAVIISEHAPVSEIRRMLETAGVEVIAEIEAEDITEVFGARQLEGVRTNTRTFHCDLAVVCGPRVPNNGLLAQAGGKLKWIDAQGIFVATSLPAHVTAVGGAAGIGVRNNGTFPPVSPAWRDDAFVCLCLDVTASSLHKAIHNGFDHIETLKRYTRLSKGPCQGRMCQLAGIGICASETGRGMQETGTTVSRPPNPPVSLGALAGPRHHPVRRTPLHYEHESAGAVWMDMGGWQRPRYYDPEKTGDSLKCIEREYRAVRGRAGIIDVGTLGKLEVKGTGAGSLLDKLYTHRFSDLEEGRVRYAVLCDESGNILDDGTISRIGPERFFVTTTTSNLDFVQQWMEWWIAGTYSQVHITNLTAGLSSVNIAGPMARDVLASLTALPLDTASFPYMACREAEVAGVAATLMRIGFVGETGWEIHAPAECGHLIWNALLHTGKWCSLTPFGVEAQRVLRLEKRHVIVGVDTDAMTTPYEVDLSWAVRLKKPDFVGRARLAHLHGESLRRTLVGFELIGEEPPEDGSPVLIKGVPAGWVTSSRFSWTARKVIGMAWVPAEHRRNGAEIVIRSEGRDFPAAIALGAFYDPSGERLKQ